MRSVCFEISASISLISAVRPWTVATISSSFSLSYIIARPRAEFYKNRQNLVLEVESAYPEGKNTLLIIIGESQNKTHMQLYGYPRQTNPLLMEIKDELTIYNDVCSPAIHTLTCMKQILTFTNYEQPDMYKKEANIIELLHFGGYKTPPTPVKKLSNAAIYLSECFFRVYKLIF